jgi:hypothetical protein
VPSRVAIGAPSSTNTRTWPSGAARMSASATAGSWADRARPACGDRAGRTDVQQQPSPSRPPRARRAPVDRRSPGVRCRARAVRSGRRTPCRPDRGGYAPRSCRRCA